MIWPADVLASQALAAGFEGDDAVMAVAVAVASTGGDDAYVWPAQSFGSSPLVGAWAIPDSGEELLGGLDLYRLSQNAVAARRLWTAVGRSWHWSATWRAGIPAATLTEARTAVSKPARGVPAGVRFPELETVTRGPDLVRASEQVRAGIDQALRFVANPRF